MVKVKAALPEVYNPEEPAANQVAGLTVAVGVAMTVAALFLAREVLVPLVMAALLSFALSPPMLWLRRHHVPRTASVAIVVTLAFCVILGFGRLIVGQVSSLADNLPAYQHNVESKIKSLQGVTKTGSGMLGRIADTLQNFDKQIDNSPTAATSGSRPGHLLDSSVQRPLPVQIQTTSNAPLQLLQSVIGPLLAPLATTGLVIVFVISFLFQRENLRDRFIRLVGSRDLHRTTEALNEAGSRVSRYLLLQGLVNVVYAVPIYAGLSLIGVPNALLWALLTAIMRFVPYLGIIIASVAPIILSVAADPGWNMLAYTAALFVSIELVFGNVIEPWLYGMNTGLSPVAIIVAATFWTWLWGPIGLLLSTPLTVCVVVLGRHAPPLRFLHVLLGNDAPLAPPEMFYQRLLADDPGEAAEHCEAFLKERSLAAIYDDVVLPALALAQDDSDRGVLSRALRARIRRGMAEVIETFAAIEKIEIATPKPDAPHDSMPPVLCISGRNDLDESALALLVQLLHQRGVTARLESAETVLAQGAEELDVRGSAHTRVIFVSSMSASPVKAKLLIRKLRRLHLPDTRIMVGFWAAPLASETARRDRLAATGGDMIVTRLQDAVEEIVTSIIPEENDSLFELTQAAAHALQQM